MAKLATVFFLAFLCTAAHAQNLVVEFEVPRGYRPAYTGTDDQGSEKFDLNGDGRPEIVMTRDDAQGAPSELIVVDVDSDGLYELIIDNQVGDVFEVWGAGESGRSRH